MAYTEKIAKVLQKVEESKHEDVHVDKRRLAFIKAGAEPTIIDDLLNMKKGCFAKVRLPLDSENISDSFVEFRILTGQEEADIHDQMDKLGYPKTHIQYDIYYISKVLSCASQPTLEVEPKVSEKTLRKCLPYWYLAVLGMAYDDFRRRVNPRFEELSAEQLNYILQQVEAAEDDTKKLATLVGLSGRLMPEAFLGTVKKLETLTKQLDKLSTGL